MSHQVGRSGFMPVLGDAEGEAPGRNVWSSKTRTGGLPRADVDGMAIIEAGREVGDLFRHLEQPDSDSPHWEGLSSGADCLHAPASALGQTLARHGAQAIVTRLPAQNDGSRPVQDSSPLDWAMEVLGVAFRQAGKQTCWSDIMRVVASHGSSAVALAQELHKEGWEAVYLNPDVTTPADGNAGHVTTAQQVARGKPCLGIPIDHWVVNYQPSPGSPTRRESAGLTHLRTLRFFFGLGSGGAPCFVGRSGRVCEFRQEPNHAILRETALEEWGIGSGVILVPPGTWAR